MLDVQILSTDNIKPSSPTPHHNRRMQFSLIDQAFPQIYVPVVLFFSTNVSNRVETSRHLKRSLSETLTHFYPLAGRITDDGLSVDCNDQGVDFFVAQVNGQMSEFFNGSQNVGVLLHLLPSYMFRTRSGKAVILAVQVNFFQCGGTAIGVGINHRTADATSLAMFLNEWAGVARDGTHSPVCPNFNGATIFPPGPALEPQSSNTPNESLKTKRFVFSASSISALQDRATSRLHVERPTRVEAVSSLIWACMARTQVMPVGETAALQATCLRKRADPPLPENSFGNLLWIGVAQWVTGEVCHEDMKGCLEAQMRTAISTVDADCIRGLQRPEAYEAIKTKIMASKPNASRPNNFFFSSWCRIPFYEVDFGWGRPTWVGQAVNYMENMTILVDTKSGDGIEAWVTLDREKMAIFEQDQDLRLFVSSSSIAIV